MHIEKGTDFFDVEQEFFVIDSDNLESVETKLYGYSVQQSGIFEKSNLTGEAVANFDGCGCYIYVERRKNQNCNLQTPNGLSGGVELIISQDFNGSYGLYLFKSDSYFALSNSFFRLLDHIKLQFTLSLNRDYANHILLNTLASQAYSETPINEIELLPRDVVVHIDVDKAELTLSPVDYAEGSLALDSREGMDTLDAWFSKWTELVRRLAAQTNQIQVNLSGGFDSRITFMLALMSGIDLNAIHVYSTDDDLHSHAEDYKIASEIAAAYGFKLNRAVFRREVLHYTMADILDIAFYTKMGFHKEMYFKHSKACKKRFYIGGDGGECVRAYGDATAEAFVAKSKRPAEKKYSKRLAKEFAASTERLVRACYKNLEAKYGARVLESTDIPSLVYNETRNRSHFGKAAVESWFSNTCVLQPLIDPMLRHLRLSTKECPDKNLLLAIVYARYCPKLLAFPFEGKRRGIAEATYRHAEAISERFPRCEPHDNGEKEPFSVIIEDREVADILARGLDNPAVPCGAPEAYLKEAFSSTSLRQLFASCFDEEIWVYARNAEKTADYFSMREPYAVLALSRVIEDLIARNRTLAQSPFEEMDRFIRVGATLAKIEPNPLAAASTAIAINVRRGIASFKKKKKKTVHAVHHCLDELGIGRKRSGLTN